MVDLIRPKSLPTTGSVAADAAFIMDDGTDVFQVTAAQIVAAAPIPSLIYSTLGAFKAAAITNKVQTLRDPSLAFGLFNWETANAPYTADDANIIKADSTALSVGAWVRQKSSTLTFANSGTGAGLRTMEAKLRDTYSVLDTLPVADGAANDYTKLSQANANARARKLPLYFSGDTFLFNTALSFGLTGDDLRFTAGTILKYGGTGNAAVTIDATGDSNPNGSYGVLFGADAAPTIQANASTNYGVRVNNSNRAGINFNCTAAAAAALRIDFSVLNHYQIQASANRAPFITVPVNGILIEGDSAKPSTANVFDIPVIEGVSGVGILNKHGQHNIIIGGSSEGNGGGYREESVARGQLVFGLFCESNSGYDFDLQGYSSTIVGAVSNSSAGSYISGARYRITQSLLKKLTVAPGAADTVLRDTATIDLANGGGLSDSGTRTRYDNVWVETATGSRSLPDWRPRPKIKVVGPITITGATQGARALVTIPSHGLDWHESVTISGVVGMTQLNGNTYQVEPNDDNSVYLMTGGAYVNSTGFTAYSSGGVATMVAFTGTWVNFGGSQATAGFWRDAEGLVHLRGSIKLGTVGTAAFTLPAGYRPTANLGFVVGNYSDSTLGLAKITSAGVLSIDGSIVNTMVCLDGISFLAEQ